MKERTFVWKSTARTSALKHSTAVALNAGYKTISSSCQTPHADAMSGPPDPEP